MGRNPPPPVVLLLSKEMLFYLQAVKAENAEAAFHHYQGAFRSVYPTDHAVLFHFGQLLT